MQLRGSTVFAPALPPPVRAEATAATLFAPALDPPVRADGTAATLFALVLLPPMRADATAAALFAPALLPPVRADGTAAALFAKSLVPPVWADRPLPRRGLSLFVGRLRLASHVYGVADFLNWGLNKWLRRKVTSRGASSRACEEEPIQHVPERAACTLRTANHAAAIQREAHPVWSSLSMGSNASCCSRWLGE